jgi:hypothetical protein
MEVGGTLSLLPLVGLSFERCPQNLNWMFLANEFGIQMVTRLKKKMHTKLPMLALDAWLLRKRAIAESIIDQLKNISQIEYSRHRSSMNFLVNLMCGLIAYGHQPKKPGLLRVTDELIAA